MALESNTSDLTSDFEWTSLRVCNALVVVTPEYGAAGYLGDPHVPLPEPRPQGGGGARGVREEEVQGDLVSGPRTHLDVH